MKSVLIRFHDKNYYVKYDDLLNKANNKFFAYEDRELKIPTQYNDKPLVLNKNEIEKNLKNSIKMPTKMPSNLATEKKMAQRTNEQKLRKYIREEVIRYISEKKKKNDAPSKEELIAQEKAAKEKAEKIAYQRFFSKALAKFGVSGVTSLPKDKKKEFFDYIDANWTSKQEQPVKKKTEGMHINELWKGTLQQNYDDDFDQFVQYDEVYGISKRLGFNSPEEAWHVNPNIQVGVKPEDLKIIDETSGTGGVAGYETPRAFTGQKGVSKKQKSIANQLGYELVDKSYAVKDQGDTQDLTDGKLNESQAYYCRTCGERMEHEEYEDNPNRKCSNCGDSDWVGEYERDAMKSNKLKNKKKLKEEIDTLYLKDENLTPEQKLGRAMRQVRNNLYEIEDVVKKSVALKRENNIGTENLGKRAYSSLKKIHETVTRLMVALNDMR